MIRSRDWLLDFAVKHFGMDRDELASVAADAESAGASFHTFAYERGILDSVQSAIIQTLSDPEAILEDYEFLDVLGRGAMGVVYRARQQSLDRIVAIKTILPGAANLSERFKSEAQTIAKLVHPNIVTPYEFFEKDRRYYLVLEFLDGATLSDRLNTTGPMSEYVTWNIILQVVSGLMYAKQSNIVHRDIKPQNLFLLECPPGFNLPGGIPFLKIADFGLAASIDRSKDTRLTLDGKVIGTPLYMAPEQASDSHVDHRADIYAIGATAYHMLSGKPLYDGESLMKLLVKKQSGAAPRLDSQRDNITAASADLVEDMMQVDPEARPGDYAVIADRIKSILAAANTSAASYDTKNNATLETIELDALPASETDTQLSGDGLEPPSEINKQPNPERAKWKWLALGAALILFPLGLMFFPSGSPSVFQTPMQSTDRAVPLYEPPGVAGWTSTGGSLNSELDGEKADVLELSGIARRQLPDYPYFVFRCGVNLLESDAITLRFLDANASTAIEIEVTSELINVMSSGGSEQTHMLKKNPWRGVTEDEPRYLEVMVATEPGRWEVRFDGAPIAEVPPPETEATKGLEIESDEPVHLESVVFSERSVMQAPSQ